MGTGRARLAALLAVGGAVAVGCADQAGTPGPSPTSTVGSPSTESPTAAESPTAPSTAPTQEDSVDMLQAVVDAASADLLGRTTSGTATVEVVLARAETFPDSALGCPQPGVAYAQAQVDGFRVLLGRGDRVWLYTAGPDGVPALCPSGEKDGGRELVPRPGPTS